MVVVCVRCKKPVYDCTAIGRDFSGDTAHAKDFVPLSEKVAAPKAGEPMICPYCQKNFAFFSEKGGACLLLENGAWWPHPPIKTS